MPHSFTISNNISQQFARVSADHNPLHLDPVAARRTQFGGTLIHGVCGTLKALDLYLENSAACTIRHIKVKYPRPVRQGQTLSVTSTATDNGQVRLEVFAGDIRCQIIDLELASAGGDDPRLYPAPDETPLCHERSIEDCQGLSLDLPLAWDESPALSLFPNAGRCLPPWQLAALMAATRFVGMECPGLHSVFAGLEFDFDHSAQVSTGPACLNFSVESTDPRIRQAKIAVRGDGVTGQLETFFRAPPVDQAGMEQIVPLVSGNEFAGQQALVVGGSRGLGEVIAKVLAAGGARVMITYASGQADALRVRDEIGRCRETPSTAAFDVLSADMDADLADFCTGITHLYYLASPVIARSESRDWDDALFSRYNRFYVEAMSKLVEQVAQSRRETGACTLFIPSSVFLDKAPKGFAEYAAAKGEAENWAGGFAASHDDWNAVFPRLPRLHTDQTSGVRGLDEQQTLDVIIGALRDCARAGSD